MSAQRFCHGERNTCKLQKKTRSKTFMKGRQEGKFYSKTVSFHRKWRCYHLPIFYSREVKLLNRVWLFATPWTVAYQAPPSMEFSRQEYWSGLPFPSPGDLSDPGIECGSPALQADTLPSEPPKRAPKTKSTLPYSLSSLLLAHRLLIHMLQYSCGIGLIITNGTKISNMQETCSQKTGVLKTFS